MDANYWKGFFDEAKGFHKAVNNAVKKEKYNPETNYNIITMAVEKYLVAYLFKLNITATNHTLSGLIEEIKYQKQEVSDFIMKEIFFIDSFQYICSIEGFEMKSPSKDEVERMSNALNAISLWVEDFVEKNTCVTCS